MIKCDIFVAKSNENDKIFAVDIQTRFAVADISDAVLVVALKHIWFESLSEVVFSTLLTQTMLIE